MTRALQSNNADLQHEATFWFCEQSSTGMNTTHVFNLGCHWFLTSCLNYMMTLYVMARDLIYFK